jgi:hypothetical protein
MEPIPDENDRSATNTMSPNRVVLFADILGFAALTEANSLDLQMLRAHNRLSFPGSLDAILNRPRDPLARTFSAFHSSLQWQIMMAQGQYPLTAITFSDSVFVATTQLYQATSFAANFARSMLSQKIPMRIGIAFGSFAALRFRSDVSDDGGDHAAQFLGSSVVRAYQAEKCGIKGMRILLHPSIEPLLGDTSHAPATPPLGTAPVKPLECQSAELANNAGVRFELDYWDFPIMQERKTWRGFQDMWTAAPHAAKAQYQGTAEAIDRMRMARGEAPLIGLRRLTLPRRKK